MGIEGHRAFWTRVATENNWNVPIVYVQLFVDRNTGDILDSVSHRDLTEDLLDLE